MDDVFTVVGLKRDENTTKKPPVASQCIADYEDNVKDYPNELRFYKEITPGYQKDGVRYVFSAKLH